MEPFPILKALSRQIAEDLVESSKQACKIHPRNIKNILPADVISTIVSKLAKNDGKYVKFKEVPLAFKVFDKLPGFLQKNRVDAILEDGIQRAGLNTLMETICSHESDDAPEEQLDDNEILRIKLTAVAVSIILFYLDGDAAYLNGIFELKGKSAGGRRTRKQNHRRHKTRGHKTRGSRRHNRHSTRKHH